MKKILFILASLVVSLGFFTGCEPTPYYTSTTQQQQAAKHKQHKKKKKKVRQVASERPVYRVNEHTQVVHDPFNNFWFWMYLSSDNRTYVTSYSTTPPSNWSTISSTPPVSSVNVESFASHQSNLQAVDPEVAENSPAGNIDNTAAAPVEVHTETVTEAEISSWENEGGNLGPQEADTETDSSMDTADTDSSTDTSTDTPDSSPDTSSDSSSSDSGSSDSGSSDSGSSDSGGGDSGGGDSGGE